MVTHPQPAAAQPAPPGIDAATETSIVLLVARHVCLGRVPDEDREDLEQYLRQSLLARACRYRADQGAWATFVRTVLLGELRRWQAHRLRGCRHGRQAASIFAGEGVALTDWAAAIPAPAQPAGSDPAELRQEVAAVLGRLAPSDQQVARLLMAMGPAAVARQVGCGRGCVYRAIARIRDAFSAAGVEA